MTIKTTGQCCLCLFLAISTLLTEADIKKIYTVIMPDNTVRKMVIMVQEGVFYNMTAITVSVEGLAPFNYSYSPLDVTSNIYQLKYSGHSIPVTALSSGNLHSAQFSQQQLYWVMDSPPFIASNGTMLLPVFYMDSESAYPTPEATQTESESGATASPPASKHLAGYHYSAGFENQPPANLHFNVIADFLGHLLQTSNEFFRITSAGPPEFIVPDEWPEFGNFKNTESSDDEASSLSEDSDTEGLDLSLKKCHISSPYSSWKEDDDDPPSPFDQHINPLHFIQQCDLGNFPLKNSSREITGLWRDFRKQHHSYTFDPSIPIILILELWKKNH